MLCKDKLKREKSKNLKQVGSSSKAVDRTVVIKKQRNFQSIFSVQKTPIIIIFRNSEVIHKVGLSVETWSLFCLSHRLKSTVLRVTSLALQHSHVMIWDQFSVKTTY